MTMTAGATDLLDLNLSDTERKRVNALLGNGEFPLGESAAAIRGRVDHEGLAGLMDANGGRGADFAQNQSQGVWAENLLSAYQGPVWFVPFGLSDPIAPTDPAYEQVRRQHRYILLIEGKRPDFLLFDASTLANHPEIFDWKNRQLTDADRTLLREHCLAGGEIKSSLQDMGKRLKLIAVDPTIRGISITVKEEEFGDLDRWQTENATPIVIVQVFVDSIYCASYLRFRKLVDEKSEHIRSWREAKTTKYTYYLPIDTDVPKVADIALLEPFAFDPGDDRGGVKRPARWPQAELRNVAMPALEVLKAHHRRT